MKIGFQEVIEKARPPLRYHGGKWGIAPWIISHFPAHTQYVEPFGGGAGVLLRKERCKVEVYNDLDEDVVSLFRLMRDVTTAERLIELVIRTPFSRREFVLAYERTEDLMERARRLLVRSWAGFGTHSFNIENSNGFRGRAAKGRKAYASEWGGVPAALRFFMERLDGVVIESLPAQRIIPYYDNPGTLFYLDPPYPRSTRNCNEKGYRHEMSDHDHRNLAWVVKACQSRFVISGYPCDLYDRHLYADWHRTERKAKASGRNGAVERTEVLWMNFEPSGKTVETVGTRDGAGVGTGLKPGVTEIMQKD